MCWLLPPSDKGPVFGTLCSSLGLWHGDAPALPSRPWQIGPQFPVLDPMYTSPWNLFRCLCPSSSKAEPGLPDRRHARFPNVIERGAPTQRGTDPGSPSAAGRGRWGQGRMKEGCQGSSSVSATSPLGEELLFLHLCNHDELWTEPHQNVTRDDCLVGLL
jgi:hypothetical protein